MKLVTVIPISSNAGNETLSYFTTKHATPGMLVGVPVRKKIVNAIVAHVEDALVSKTEIKNADFSMKKVAHVKEGVYFLPAFIEAGAKAARYFASTTGTIVEALTPQIIIKELLKPASKDLAVEPVPLSSAEQKLVNEKYLFQTEEKERLASYKSLIREEFARKNSVFLCIPTIQDIERAEPVLKRGIEDYTYVFHSKLPQKTILALWKKIIREPHPVLIIGTGLFFSIPRSDIKTIIVERENAGGYKIPFRPFFDLRIFSEFFAHALGAKLIWGDTVLRTETLHAKDRGEFLERSPLKFRALSNAEQIVVDMKEIKDISGKEKFSLLSHELLKHIQSACESNERAFLLVARRGLYPLTLCSDCGKVVLCKHCDAPLVLHGKKEEPNVKIAHNRFMCHQCGVRSESKDICEACSSWRLTSLGIGAERVEKELSRLFPHVKIFTLHKDSAPTQKRAQKIVEQFYASPGSILVGTEMAVSLLSKKIATVGVVSIDSLFTLADFRISERVFSLLLRLRGRAASHFLIQTRVRHTPLFEYIVRGNILDFYRNEIALRKSFRYPPFTTLIKISAAVKKENLEKTVETLRELFGEYNPDFYPAFVPKIKNQYVINVLLKIEKTGWPEEKLLALLYSLPPSFTIKVDPESVL